MRLLPKEWEGTSPLLPKPLDDVPSGTSYAIFNSVFWGCFVGTSLGMFKRGYMRVFSHKFPQQQFQGNNAMWSTIGVCNAISAVYHGNSEFWQRRLAKAEASAILNEAGIPMPAFKLWEKTKKVTMDDVMIGVGVATTLSALALQKSRIARLSGWGILGQTSVSMIIGYTAPMLWNGKKTGQAINQYKLELLAASKAYTAHTGKPAPRVLYGTYEADPVGGPVEQIHASPYPTQYSGVPSSDSPMGVLQPLDVPDASKIEPQPPGSQPHHCILLNGSIVYGATRDYFWEPENPESGIQELKEHIRHLNEKRTKLVQEAAFLFQEVAQRENKYLAMDKDEHDTEAGRKSRKAVELLSSMHSNTYTEIAELDWLISDSKKMVLQLETNGTWMPKNQGSPDPKVTEAILDKIRQHQKKTEHILQQLAYMVVPAENQSQIEEDLREVKENAEATTDLMEYFEDISKPR